MTSSRRHSRAPLRRSSAPEKILSAGLATAICVGIVGLIGVRTLDANAGEQEAEATADQSAAVPQPVVPTTPAMPATTSAGLTQAQLDAYAAQLEAERARLDEYRAKLVRAAKKLQRQAAYQPAAGYSSTTVTYRAPAAQAASGAAARPSSRPAVMPAAKPGSGSGQQTSAPAPAAPLAPAKPAPTPVAAPAQQQAAAPSNGGGGAATTTRAS